VASAADALIFDLEDSVTAELLPQARARVRDFLGAQRQRAAQQRWVRVNALTSGKLSADLAAVMPGAPDGIVLPKVSFAREALEVARSAERIWSANTIGRWARRSFSSSPPKLHNRSWHCATTRAPPMRASQDLTWGAEDLSAALGAAARGSGRLA
jgi:citrate lyase subunit beta/citryl-CoA lyase